MIAPNIDLGIPKWHTGVRQWPIFAEYTEGPVADGTSGLSDTGLTMRAFLPIDRDKNTSLLHKYEGPSTVIDARVVCMRPNITNLTVSLPPRRIEGEWLTPRVEGNLSIPSDLMESARSSRMYPRAWQDFNCFLPQAIAPGSASRKYHAADWNLTVCQLDRVAGMLISDFRNSTDSTPEHAISFMSDTYLLMNFSSKLYFDEPAYPVVDYSELPRMFNQSAPDLVYQHKNDWLEIYRKDGSSSKTQTVLSFSMCFPASGTKYLNISASSIVPLVQP